MKKLLGIVVLGLLWCSTSFADHLSTQNLKSECKAAVKVLGLNSKAEMSALNLALSEYTGIASCFGYFDGLYDSAMIQKAEASPDKPQKYWKEYKFITACPPIKVNRNQLIQIFNKYISDHPEKLHEPAILTVGLAMVEAFPCK